MALNFGIKVTRPGYSTTTTDPRQMLMSSAYQMFKYHGEYTTSVTFNPGDHTATASVTHNLGYVPAFMAYGVRSDDSANFIIPSIPYATSEFDWGEAWADTTKIYFKVTLFPGYGMGDAGWNELIIDATDYYGEWSGASGRNLYVIGNNTADGYGDEHGAMRFPSISLAKDQSISSATLNAYSSSKGIGSSDVKMKTYGIDEDNTGDFGSNPMGRSKTTAVTTQSQVMLLNEWWGINVKSQVQEIIARSGWSSGNAMGFILNNDSSPNDCEMKDDIGGTNSFLSILLPGTLTVSFRAIVFKDKIAT